MNHDGTSLWSHHHQVSPTSGESGDNAAEDFSSLFDFNNIQLSMSSPFDTTGAQDDHSAMDTDFTNADELRANGHSNDVGGPLDTSLLGSEDMLDMQFHDLHSLQTSQQQQHSHHHHHHQQHQQHHQQQQQHHHHHAQMLVRQHMMQQSGMIPPTPSSIDLQTGLPHGPCSHMGSQSDIMMDRYNGLRDEQMIFTPLVSPAVTPLDTNFVHQVPEFAIPGYFSPLTSPALDAHPHRTHMPNPHMVHSHSQSTSPIDPVGSPNINKRGNTGRRKSNTSRNPARVVRESPSMKAQRKKLPVALAATPELANALSKQPPTPTTVRQSASQYQNQEQMGFQSSRDSSSNESVSPEPLPEVLMAPPPPRNGNSRSPQNGRSDDGSSTSTTPGAPATPASLMKLTKTNLPTEDIPPIAMETSDFLNGDVERVMADAPPVSRNDGGSGGGAGGGGMATAMASPRLGGDNQSTPTIGASRTPSMKPVPLSSSSISSGSRHESPINIQTPSSVLNKQKVSKSGATGRGGKRGSVSSSPALQPKISPSIKPLLPSGMTPEASALLLKSNYQNIVEGTHKQLGLSYPADLSTNLTSKRTSHKIAEQGRRNRINNALAEIASLLPQKSTTSSSSSNGGSNSDGGGGEEGKGSTSGGGGEGRMGSGGVGGGGGGTSAGQASKASTVEMAIDYIKQLKKELEDTKEKLADAERRLEEKAGGDN